MKKSLLGFLRFFFLGERYVERVECIQHSAEKEK